MRINGLSTVGHRWRGWPAAALLKAQCGERAGDWLGRVSYHTVSYHNSDTWGLEYHDNSQVCERTPRTIKHYQHRPRSQNNFTRSRRRVEHRCMSVGHSTGHGTPRRHSGQVSGQRALTAVPYYVRCVVSARCMPRAVHRSQFTQPPAAAPPHTSGSD